MIFHLSDPTSPLKTIFITNPGYYSVKDNIFQLTKQQWQGIYGNVDDPTIPMELHSLSYCGEPLIHKPRPHPELLWDCVNFIFPYNILSFPRNQICWECISILDKYRKENGKVPVILALRHRDAYNFITQLPSSVGKTLRQFTKRLCS